MAVTVSLVVLFGFALFFLLRARSLSAGAAFTAAGFGFFLAATGAAAPINHLTGALIAAIPGL